jgi:hypothetical protein
MVSWCCRLAGCFGDCQNEVRLKIITPSFAFSSFFAEILVLLCPNA